MVGNFFTGRYAVRFGVNRMVLAGALISTGGMLVLAALQAMGVAGQLLFFGLMITVGLGNGLLMPNANAGMLSVRPQLAGSAAGLGGAFMIGGGAALSAIAGFILGPKTGPMPLILLMLATSAASILSILWVLRREKALSNG
jgi:DHA1 family bicyclomycin/chloramphenicol resistance-like MFS transporter